MGLGLQAEENWELAVLSLAKGKLLGAFWVVGLSLNEVGRLKVKWEVCLSLGMGVGFMVLLKSSRGANQGGMGARENIGL